MRCQNCGREYEGKFCPDCGTPAEGVLPDTSSEIYVSPYPSESAIVQGNTFTYNNQPVIDKVPWYLQMWFISIVFWAGSLVFGLGIIAGIILFCMRLVKYPKHRKSAIISGVAQIAIIVLITVWAVYDDGKDDRAIQKYLNAGDIDGAKTYVSKNFDASTYQYYAKMADIYESIEDYDSAASTIMDYCSICDLADVGTSVTDRLMKYKPKVSEEIASQIEDLNSKIVEARSTREALEKEAEAAKAEAEQAKADAEAAKAETEQAKADAEAAKAETEQAKADADAAKAETEQAKADANAAIAEAEQSKEAQTSSNANAHNSTTNTSASNTSTQTVTAESNQTSQTTNTIQYYPDEFDNMCYEVTFDDLMRYSDQYEGEYVRMTCNVFNVYNKGEYFGVSYCTPEWDDLYNTYHYFTGSGGKAFIVDCRDKGIILDEFGYNSVKVLDGDTIYVMGKFTGLVDATFFDNPIEMPEIEAYWIEVVGEANQ